MSKSQQVEMSQEYEMEGDLSKKPVGDMIDNFMTEALEAPQSKEELEHEAAQKKIVAAINKVDTAYKELSKTYLM